MISDWYKSLHKQTDKPRRVCSHESSTADLHAGQVRAFLKATFRPIPTVVMRQSGTKRSITVSITQYINVSSVYSFGILASNTSSNLIGRAALASVIYWSLLTYLWMDSKQFLIRVNIIPCNYIFIWCLYYVWICIISAVPNAFKCNVRIAIFILYKII